MSIVSHIGNIVLFSSFIPLGIFIYFYWTRSPWTERPMGVALMVQKIDLFAILLLGAFTAVLGFEFLGRDYVRLVLFTIVVATFWFDLYLLGKIQGESRRITRRERQTLTRFSFVKPKKPSEKLKEESTSE